MAADLASRAPMRDALDPAAGVRLASTTGAPAPRRAMPDAGRFFRSRAGDLWRLRQSAIASR